MLGVPLALWTRGEPEITLLGASAQNLKRLVRFLARSPQPPVAATG
jgi:hypothetical protein